MPEEMDARAAPTAASDEELCDVLIAISVVAKQLSRKLRTQAEEDRKKDTGSQD